MFKRLLPLLLLLPGAVWATAFVQSSPVGKLVGQPSVTLTISGVSAGDDLFVAGTLDTFGSATAALSCNDGNAYTVVASQLWDANSQGITVLLRLRGAAAGTHSIVCAVTSGGVSASSTFGQLEAIETSPRAANVDVVSATTGTSATPSLQLPSSGGFSEPSEFALVVLGGNANNSLSGISASFTGGTNLYQDTADTIAPFSVDYEDTSSASAITAAYGTAVNSGLWSEIAVGLPPAATSGDPIQTSAIAKLVGAQSVTITINGVTVGDEILVYGSVDTFTEQSAGVTVNDGSAYNAVGTVLWDLDNQAITGIWRQRNAVAGTHSITILTSGPTSYGQFQAVEISPKALAVDAYATAAGSSTTPTLTLPASGSFSQSPDFVLGVLSGNPANSLSGINNTFTGGTNLYQDTADTIAPLSFDFENTASTSALSMAYGTAGTSGVWNEVAVALAPPNSPTNALSAAFSDSSSLASRLVAAASVTLTSPLYTGVGGILDPNFWIDSKPQVGSSVSYDPTAMTMLPDGEIFSALNPITTSVQFLDSTGALAQGTVAIVPGPVVYNVDTTSVLTGTLSGPAVIPIVVTQLAQLPFFVVRHGSGTYNYSISSYFSATATSFSVSPSLPTGWSLNTSTGALSIDSSAQSAGTYGPFTFSATGGSSTKNGNAVTIKLAASGGRSLNENPF